MVQTSLIFLLWVSALSAKVPQASSEQQLAQLNRQYKEAYDAKQYARALEALTAMSSFPEVQNDTKTRSLVLYGQACLHSVMGHRREALDTLRKSIAAGFNDYLTFKGESDLGPLRKDPEFQALATQFKAKYGPVPLAWDAKQPTPDFPLLYDDLKIAELAQLREEFAIDKVVDGAKDDYDKLVRLTKWTSDQWQHSSSQMASKPDPISILREAKAGGRFICRDYAIVAAGAARAYGFPARHLAILPRDVETRSEAHSVAEVWLPKFRKWIIADGQYGIVPESKGVPLNAVELQKAIAEEVPIACRGASEKCKEWQEFIFPNLFYFKIAQDQRRFGGAPGKQLVLVPKGAPEPHKFAGANEGVFSNSIYTSNPQSFYAPPPR